MKIITQKKLIKVWHYNCLYSNKGNTSNVMILILTKLIGFRDSMVLIIHTKNACLFDLILYVHSTIFQLCGTGLPGLNQY